MDHQAHMVSGDVPAVSAHESIRDAVIQSVKSWRMTRQRNLFLTINPAVSPSGVIDLDGADLSALDFSPVQYWVVIETENGTERVLRNLCLTIDQFTHLTRVNLTATKMSSAQCTRTRFHGALLIDTDLSKTRWLRVDATNTVLDGSRFSQSELRRSDFSGSKASPSHSANFTQCKASYCLFVSASLPCIKANQAQFVACDFKGADLTGGDFEYANCKASDFRGAKVDRMRVSHGNFSNADWRGVDLSKVIGFDWQNFKGAKMDGAILPALAGDQPLSGCCHWSFFSPRLAPWLGNDYSLVLVKPEGNLFTISQALGEHGLSILAMRTLFPGRDQITNLYRLMKNYYFFGALRAYLVGRKIIALVVQGDPDQLMACKLAVRAKHAEDLGEAPLKELAIQGKYLDNIDHQRVYRHQYLSTFDLMHASDSGKGPDEVAQFFRVDDLMGGFIEDDQRVRIVLSLLEHPNRYNDPPKGLPISPASDDNELRLMIVKPDGMRFLPIVLHQMQEKQLALVAAKFVRLKKSQVVKLYAKYIGRYFCDALVQCLSDRSLIVMAVQGKDDVFRAYRQALRTGLGGLILEPAEQALSQYQAAHPNENVHDVRLDDFKDEYAKTFESIHCSDAGDGQKELKLFFQSADLRPHTPIGAEEKWVIMERLLADRAASRQAGVIENSSLTFRQDTSVSRVHVI